MLAYWLQIHTFICPYSTFKYRPKHIYTVKRPSDPIYRWTPCRFFLPPSLLPLTDGVDFFFHSRFTITRTQANHYFPLFSCFFPNTSEFWRCGFFLRSFRSNVVVVVVIICFVFFALNFFLRDIFFWFLSLRERDFFLAATCFWELSLFFLSLFVSSLFFVRGNTCLATWYVSIFFFLLLYFFCFVYGKKIFTWNSYKFR